MTEETGQQPDLVPEIAEPVDEALNEISRQLEGASPAERRSILGRVHNRLGELGVDVTDIGMPQPGERIGRSGKTREQILHEKGISHWVLSRMLAPRMDRLTPPYQGRAPKH